MSSSVGNGTITIGLKTKINFGHQGRIRAKSRKSLLELLWVSVFQDFFKRNIDNIF